MDVHELVFDQASSRRLDEGSDQSHAGRAAVPGVNRDIEILRAVAILFTIVEHATVLTNGGPLHDFIYQNFTFWGGVDLFFCISGYVITASLYSRGRENAVADPELSGRSIRDFWIKRAYRLLPAAWLWALVVFLLSFGFNDSGAFGLVRYNFQSLIAIITYTYNFWYNDVMPGADPVGKFAALFPLGVYWSLSLEEQFYFFYPILLKFLKKRGFLILAAIVIAVEFPLVRNGLLRLIRLDGLMWGILIFHFSRTDLAEAFRPVFMRRPGAKLAMQAILLLLIAAIPVALSQLSIATGVLVLPCALLVLIASYGRGYIGTGSRAIDGALVWIGSRSYSLYLTHMIGLLIVSEGGSRLRAAGNVIDLASSAWRLPIALLLMLCLAEASYRLVERPLRMRGRKIVAAPCLICDRV